MAASRGPRALRVPDDVVRLVRNLHPRLKSKVKEAVRTIRDDPNAGKVLKEELVGLRSYRVARFRVVYRLADEGTVEIVAIGPRKSVYQETLRILKKGL